MKLSDKVAWAIEVTDAVLKQGKRTKTRGASSLAPKLIGIPFENTKYGMFVEISEEMSGDTTEEYVKVLNMILGVRGALVARADDVVYIDE